MGKPLPLPVWDRQRGRRFAEWMDENPATYESRPDRSITQWLRSHPLYDWAVAAYQNTRLSRREITPFIRKNGIDMSEFEDVDYQSFAAFFDREFRAGARSFPAASAELGAFAEARYLAWERLTAEEQFPVKGHSLEAARILGTEERARPFLGGPVLLARLSPVDYHRVHYPDDGRTLDQERLGGRLWTVNWHALLNKPDILFTNERYASVLETRNFGRLGFVEVGALSVGRIAQVHPTDKAFRRGAQKSVFKFGGSAIVVFGEPGKWRPAADLMVHTMEGIETLVRLGEPLASSSA